jgi:hypothetical protein
MPLRQQIFALAVSVVVFAFTIEMVRRKRLREEYSVLWLCASFAMFVLVLKYNWLVAVTNAIGAVLPTTTLFFGSSIFLILIGIQFSMEISKLNDQVKNLVQDNALLRKRVDDLQDGRESAINRNQQVTPGPEGGSHATNMDGTVPGRAAK